MYTCADVIVEAPQCGSILLGDCECGSGLLPSRRHHHQFLSCDEWQKSETRTQLTQLWGSSRHARAASSSAASHAPLLRETLRTCRFFLGADAVLPCVGEYLAHVVGHGALQGLVIPRLELPISER